MIWGSLISSAGQSGKGGIPNTRASQNKTFQTGSFMGNTAGVIPAMNLPTNRKAQTNDYGKAIVKSVVDPSGVLGMFGEGGAGDMGNGESGYDIVQMPQYSFTEPRLRLASDYVSQNLERMQRGEYPSWYDKAQPIMRQGMMRGLNESMYGRAGERTGALQQANDQGAILGVGPKASWAQGRKLLGDYMQKSSAIDEYLTGLGVNIMQQGEGTYLQASNSMPRGPETQIVGYGGAVPSGGGSNNNAWLNAAATAANMWGSGAFSKNNNTPTTGVGPTGNYQGVTNPNVGWNTPNTMSSNNYSYGNNINPNVNWGENWTGTQPSQYQS